MCRGHVIAAAAQGPVALCCMLSPPILSCPIKKGIKRTKKLKISTRAFLEHSEFLKFSKFKWPQKNEM